MFSSLHLRPSLVLLIAVAATGAGRAEPHVVIISLDGVPARMVADPTVDVATLRRLSAQGVMATGMRPTNPSTTWSNHTSLVTGVNAARHGVLYNGVLRRDRWPPRLDPDVDRQDLVADAVVTVYDQVHAAGHRTAAINWPATGGSTTLDDNFPDRGHGVRAMTPALRTEMQDLLQDETGVHFDTLTAATRDHIWLETACRVFERRRPTLMLVHLLNTDGTNHRYGVGSYASQNALALADRCIETLLAAIDRTGERDQTTIFIVSDHGFRTPPQAAAPNVTLAEHGWLRASSLGAVIDARAYVVSNGGSGVVYFRDAVDEAKAGDVASWLAAQPGVTRVLAGDQLAAAGWPTPARNAAMGPLVVIAAPEFALVPRASGPSAGAVPESERHGYHGFSADDPDMQALFIAAGRGIKPGVPLGVIENRDLAPTVAALLDVPLPGVESRVLREILTAPTR